MHAAMRNSSNLAVPTKMQDRLAPRPNGLSGFDILAGGVHGFFPGPRARQASSPPDTAGVRGLDRIERKAEVRWMPGAAIRKAGSVATVWVGVPFALVFVLGCLTLV